MLDAFLSSLSLLNTSGVLILVAIFALLLGGIAVSLLVRARYASIARDLARNSESGEANFESAVLNHIVADTLSARYATAAVNTQAIIDHRFQTELRALLMGERFVKAATGLAIIFGLVGTFFGLSMSIGKLVTLVASDVTTPEQLTQSLTGGLVDALAGMSVAFTSSLFGILAAIVLTLFGVFASISARRSSVMVQIEAHLDHVLLAKPRDEQARSPGPSGSAGDARLERALFGFGESVSRLDAVVERFEGALTTFASSSRDFHEFNHHLRDNIQRMSLSFGDLSEVLRQQTGQLRPRDGR